MEILVLCNDKYHPARVVRDGLSWLEKEGYQLDWEEDAQGFQPEKLADYPLVILSKSNHTSSVNEQPWMIETCQAAFANYVQQGNGLLAIHSGTAGYKDTPILRALLGGVFLSHPPQCAVTMTPDSSHPLPAGSAGFTLQDEHYQMALDDEHADIFLTTTSEHGEQPGGWARTFGEGRVCVLTPGHNLPVWQHPSYQILIANTLRWCAKLG